MGSGTRVRQWAERFGKGQLVLGHKRTECREGLAFTCRLILSTTGRLQIQIPEDNLASYLRDKHCWIKIEANRKTLIRKYYPSRRKFPVPSGFWRPGEEIKVTVNRIGLNEFAAMALAEAGSSINIETDLGKYYLVVKNGRIPVTLVNLPEMRSVDGLHFEGGEQNRACVIFAI